MAILSDPVIKEGRSYIENDQQEEFHKWCEKNVSSLNLDALRRTFDKCWINPERCHKLFAAIVQNYNKYEIIKAGLKRFAVRALIVGACAYLLITLFLGMF